MGSLETSADTEQDAKPTYFESLLLVSAALYVAGRLGLQFSIPPTSTSILWPPTGIALAACLLGGPRMALAVLIGFFLTGLSLSASIPAWLAAVLAGCATIQAVATSVLIRNLIGFPGPIWRGERVPFFLLLSGPIGSTVSATLSISCYVLVGLFPASAFWGHWLTHWTGDTLGALVVMPLCLTLAARPGHAFGGRRLAVALPLAISFLLTGIVFRTALKTSSENAVQEFLRQSKRLGETVSRTLSSRVEAIGSAGELFAALGGVTPEKFEAFGRAMRRLNPGTSTVFWAPLGPLPAAAPARAPARLRLTARLPAAPIRLWTPPGGNSKALGFRLDAGETTGRGLERCLRTRSCALVCRPGLPGEPLQREQSLLLVPVGQASSGEPIAGVLGIVMWVPAMLSGADSPAAGSQLHFLLMEAGGDLPRDVVWSGQPSLGDAGEGDGHASTAGRNEWRWRNFLAVGGQLLELQCWAGAGGLDPEREMQLWVDSLWCLALTAVLGAVLLVSTGRRAAAAVARSA